MGIFDPMEKHQAAYSMYVDGWQQKDIAAIMKVTEATVVNWKKTHDWDKKRTNSVLARETSEEGLQDLIHYQLDVLRHQKDEQLKLPAAERKLIERGDIDALSKMFSSIKGKELEWGNYVVVCRELLNNIRGRDLESARLLMQYITDFLNSKRKSL